MTLPLAQHQGSNFNSNLIANLRKENKALKKDLVAAQAELRHAEMAWRGQSQRAKEILTERESVLTNAVEKMNQQ